MTFTKWLDTFLAEKNTNLDTIFEVESASGMNYIPAAVVVEHIKITTKSEQAQIKNTIVKIDFMNGDILHFFKHLARAIAR